MSPEWDTLPLLPLRCILEHLSLEDAMAAMSTCRQWRSAILLYEGRKEKLVLRAKQLEKSMHLARVFRKHTRILHMYLDCSAEDTDEFMSYVLPQFFDSAKLREIIFIGPSYIQQTHLMPVIKIKRIMTESLIYKHLHCLERFGMLGCEMGIAKVDSEKITSVIVDYEHINTEALETLCALSTFSSLTLNVGYRRQLPYGRLDWPRVHEARRARLRVHVNIVSLPHTKFDEVIENVLVEGMTLVSLKVLFCKAMYPALLDHLVAVHKDTLEELVWADCPYNSSDVYHRYQRSLGPVQFPVANVNPFIILTWQCTNIRRLVIHGYWMWQYDLLGFVRLRSTLTSIEVSAIYENQETYGDTIPRVLISDEPLPLHPTFVREMNEEGKYTFVPKTWHQLHPGLRARSTPQDRAAYTVCETLGVT
ncbi:uncharacterized protein LOC114361398 isoform X2 [Ostrinia furnacalis]|uniref:uncharacterized protein LOC114361398 isoform X2 n=1 Tax=Ostrinia furnacalis TaxID=93504 RepID=UPI00103E8DF9|nr:uncharacterized protein LOC114361398 isoform X2 [Ostrinia furnacalis]